MAACSELELEGKPSQEKRLLSSKSFDSSTNKEDASEPRNLLNSEMPKSVESNEDNKNSIDISSLTEEQLHLLLEEATTFNRPKRKDSSILQALRKEIVESDPCGDVNSNEPTFSATSSSHGKKKGKSSVNCSAGKNKQNSFSDDKCLMLDCNSFLGWQKQCDSSAYKRNGRNRDDLSASCPSRKKEVQFQSLQDLHCARFSETYDSMRAAGIGRGARKLHKAGRANSFTLPSCERSEWLGLSAQDGRTCTGKGKSPSKKETHSVATNECAEDDAERISNDTGGQDTSSSRSLSESDGTVSESVALNNWSTCSSDSSSSPEKEDCQMDPIPTLVCDKANSDVRFLSCRPLAGEGDAFYDDVKCARHPMEIEMVEFTKEEAKTVDLCCRSFVCNFDGNASMDVDAPVNFPLKSVYPARSRSEMNYISRNAAHMNGILEGDFSHCGGLTTLSLPYRSKSVAGTTSIVDDASKRDGDKEERALRKKKRSTRQEFGEEARIGQHIDHNGNPVRSIRLSDGTYGSGSYSFDGHSSKQELHLRKGKRTKLNTDIRNISKSEDVDGYRGKEDIDKLVEFINSTDRGKNKGTHKSTNGNTIYFNFTDGNKNGSALEFEKKRDKSLVKDGKVIFKTTPGAPKKSYSAGSENDENANGEGFVLESDSAEFHDAVAGNSVDCEDPPGATNEPAASSPPVESSPAVDIDSELNNVPSPDSSPSVDDSVATGFAEDFYSVTEVPPLLEESEFRVVVKKQKRRRQPKKPDSYRRHSAAASASAKYGDKDYYLNDQSYHSSNYMLLSGLPLSHRGSRGMPENIRRKSTSSVPPSEHSSADNSDLDSVHSLPVGGSVPPATRVHPHTTPSSMTSTPQASYADIARIAAISSSSKDMAESLNSCLQQGSSNTLDRTSTVDESDTVPLAISSTQDFPENAIVLECSDLEGRDKDTTEGVNTFHGIASLISAAAEPPKSVVNSESEEKRKEASKLQEPTEALKAEKSVEEVVAVDSGETDTQPVHASSVESDSSLPDAGSKVVKLKPSSKKTQPKETARPASLKNAKSRGRPPVIIFDNCQPSVNVCDVSFGFDLNEILRLGAHEIRGDVRPSSPVIRSEGNLEVASGSGRGSASDATLNSSRQSDSKSSPSENVLVISGQRYQWKDAKTDTRHFNHEQVVNFFGMAWDDVVRDYQMNPDDEDGRKCNKIKYYDNQS